MDAHDHEAEDDEEFEDFEEEEEEEYEEEDDDSNQDLDGQSFEDSSRSPNKDELDIIERDK